VTRYRLAACLLAAAAVTAAGAPAFAADPTSDLFVSFLTPNDGDTIAGGTVQLEASAVATDPAVTITHVDFAVDGQPLASDTTDPYTASWSSTPGTHILSVTGYDSLGQQDGETVQVTVGSGGSTPTPTTTPMPTTEPDPVTPGFTVNVPETGACRLPVTLDTTGLTMPYTELDVTADPGMIEDGVLFYPGAGVAPVTIIARAFNGLDLVASSAPAVVTMSPCTPTVTVAPRGGVVGRWFTAASNLDYGSLDILSLEPTTWTVDYLLDGVKVASSAAAPAFKATINASRLTGTHTLVARATNAAGVTKSSAPARVVVDSATVLGFWSRPVYYGSWSTTVASLKSVNDGKPLAGRKVGVRSYRAGRWSGWTALTTAADGTVRVVQKLPSTTVYEFGFPGQPGFRAARGTVTATVVRR
jgi:hypothetical protein